MSSKTSKGQDSGVERVTETPAPKPAEPPKQDYVSLDAFNSFAGRIENTLNGLASQMIERQSQTGSRQEPVIDDPSEEEVAAAYDSGDGRKIAAVLKRQQTAAMNKMRAALNPEIAAVRDTGLSALSSLAEQLAKKDLKHYNRFKKEIDQEISRLPQNVRITPDIYKGVHDIVVGRHIDELLEEQQTSARETYQQDLEAGKVPGVRVTRQVGAHQNDVPSVAEFLGDQAQEVLDSMGRDADDFARKMGYANHADRINKLREFQAPPPPWALPAGSTMKTIRQAQQGK